MDTGLITIALGFVFLIIQRTETKKRRGVALFMSLILLFIIWYIAVRQIWSMGITALFLALFFNFLFWLFIGRYNPVGNSDDIHVLGMDD